MQRTFVHKLVGTLVPMCILIFLLTSLNGRAQQAPAPAPDYIDAVWLAHADGLLKVAAANGTVVLDIATPYEVQAVGLDEPRGVLWTANANTLQSYTFGGIPLLSVPVPPPDTETEDTTHIALSVNPSNGTVWLGVSKRLYHFDAQGQLLHTLALSDQVRALAVDETSLHVWVATKKTLSAYTDAGTLATILDLGKNPDIQDLTLDLTFNAESGALWVALKKDLHRYDANGNLVWKTKLEEIERVAHDGAGNVWVATKKSLLRLDAAGQVLVELRQFTGDQRSVALAADPVDQSVWVATKKALWQLSAEGDILQTFDFKGTGPLQTIAGIVRALALYTDTLPPALLFSAPLDGSFLNTAIPELVLSYTGLDQGANPDTLPIAANGTELSVTCIATDTAATCTPTAPVADGPTTLTATLQDYAGNTSAPTTLSFTIDTVAPLAPQVGQITVGPIINGQVTVTGAANSVEAGTQVTITNSRTGETVTVTAASDGSFTTQLMAEAGDSLSFVVTDAAGNVSPAVAVQVGVSLQVSITQPANASTLQNNRVLVHGTYAGPVNTGITVNGVVAVVQDGTFVANDVPLAVGTNILTATATTLQGQTATDAVTITSQGETPTLEVKALPSSGIAPLEVTFEYAFNSVEAVATMSMDFDGDGTDDFTTTDPEAELLQTSPFKVT